MESRSCAVIVPLTETLIKQLTVIDTLFRSSFSLPVRVIHTNTLQRKGLP